MLKLQDGNTGLKHCLSAAKLTKTRNIKHYNIQTGTIKVTDWLS